MSKKVDEILDLLNGPQVTSVAEAIDIAKKRKTKSSSQGVNADKALQVWMDNMNEAPSKMNKAPKKMKEKVKRVPKRRKDNDVDKNLLRMQLLNYTYPYWKEIGLSSYLLMTHSHNNQVYNHNEKTLLSKDYVPEEDLKTNTARFGLTNDKGLIGYLSRDYKGQNKENIQNLLGINDEVYNTIFESKKNQDKIKTFKDQHTVDACFVQEMYTEFTHSKEDSIAISLPFASTHIGILERVANSTSSLRACMTLYIIDDFVFTTTSKINAGCIDAYQKYSNMYLPCTGIIQDFLTNFLLTKSYNCYYKNGVIETYTETIKNVACTEEERYFESAWESNNKYTCRTADGDNYVYVQEIFNVSSALFPFYLFQRGNDEPGFGIKVIHINTDLLQVLTEEVDQEKTCKEVKRKIKEVFPLGDIMPIAKLFTIQDDEKVYVMPFALDEANFYPVQPLALRDYLLEPLEQLHTYTDSDLETLNKQTMYSQAILDIIQKIRFLLDIIGVQVTAMNSDFSTINITQDSTVSTPIQVTTTNTVYACPSVITTTKDFII